MRVVYLCKPSMTYLMSCMLFTVPVDEVSSRTAAHLVLFGPVVQEFWAGSAAMLKLVALAVVSAVAFASNANAQGLSTQPVVCNRTLI
jgi:hypothetical protein